MYHYRLRDWIDVSKINWNQLSWNTSDGAIELLKQNSDKISWKDLSSNLNDGAMEMLKNY